MANIWTYTKELFFIRRRPALSKPLEWERPKSDAEYATALEWEGMISSRLWENEDASQHPVFKQDLDDLEQHLLPVFWEFNAKALHFQNRYYFYQWVFMWGAWITTLLGALTTYAYTNQTMLDNSLPQIFGFITALVSGITAFFNVMSTQGLPQQRWAKTRRLTEELRMAYYKYLAHLEPFHAEDRIQVMRRFVISVRKKEFENVQ